MDIAAILEDIRNEVPQAIGILKIAALFRPALAKDLALAEQAEPLLEAIIPPLEQLVALIQNHAAQGASPAAIGALLADVLKPLEGKTPADARAWVDRASQIV